MKPELSRKRFNLALVNLVVCGVLALVMLASLGGGWGTAYGQTAGPGFTPTPDPGNVAAPGGVAGGTGINATPVVPGLPHTGNAPTVETSSVSPLLFVLLGLLLLLMLGSSFTIMRYTRNSDR